jgi:hypothetical protein
MQLTGEELEHAKEKLRKLLAMANSTSLNEAEIAMAKANKLMEEFGINENVFCVEKDASPEFERKETYKRILASVIANLYGVISIRVERQNKEYHQFAGDEIYVFFAIEMYNYLIATVERMWKNNCKEIRGKELTKTAKSQAKKNFKIGMAQQIATKINLIGQNVSWAPERSTMKKRAESFLSEVEKDLKTKTFAATIHGNGSGYFEGIEAGKDVSLHRQASGVSGVQYLS